MGPSIRRQMDGTNGAYEAQTTRPLSHVRVECGADDSQEQDGHSGHERGVPAKGFVFGGDESGFAAMVAEVIDAFFAGTPPQFEAAKPFRGAGSSAKVEGFVTLAGVLLDG